MSEEAAPTKRRARSPENAARRAERALILPVRQRIADLQQRLAFLAATAVSSKAPDHDAIATGYRRVRAEIHFALAELDRLVTAPSLGPAEDCRRALRVLERRLPLG